MNEPCHRWHLLETSTNGAGATHFSLTRRGAGDTVEGDFDELRRILKTRFGAVDDGELVGPYSIHRYMKVDGIRFGIILDLPEWLELFTTDGSKTEAMASIVTRLLASLNE